LTLGVEKKEGMIFDVDQKKKFSKFHPEAWANQSTEALRNISKEKPIQIFKQGEGTKGRRGEQA